MVRSCGEKWCDDHQERKDECMSEEWRKIPSFGNKYQVSNSGEVFSFKFKRLLTPYLNNGYVHYHLFTPEGKAVNKRAHRLVMLSFVGDSELPVNHINGVITDNRLENLEYCTQMENVHHQNNVLKRGASINGSNVNAIFDDAQALTIITAVNMPHYKMAKHYQCDSHTISLMRRGKTYVAFFKTALDFKPEFAKADKYGNVTYKGYALKQLSE